MIWRKLLLLVLSVVAVGCQPQYSGDETPYRLVRGLWVVQYETGSDAGVPATWLVSQVGPGRDLVFCETLNAPADGFSYFYYGDIWFDELTINFSNALTDREAEGHVSVVSSGDFDPRGDRLRKFLDLTSMAFPNRATAVSEYYTFPDDWLVIQGKYTTVSPAGNDSERRFTAYRPNMDPYRVKKRSGSDEYNEVEMQSCIYDTDGTR